MNKSTFEIQILKIAKKKKKKGQKYYNDFKNEKHNLSNFFILKTLFKKADFIKFIQRNVYHKCLFSNTEA